MAPHLNGVYLGDANLAIARMFDLERIEVLKGPQGTLVRPKLHRRFDQFHHAPPQDSLCRGDRRFLRKLRHDPRARPRQPALRMQPCDCVHRLRWRRLHPKFRRRSAICRGRFLGIEGVVADSTLRRPASRLHGAAHPRRRRDRRPLAAESGVPGGPARHPPDYGHARESVPHSEIDNFNVNLEYELGFATCGPSPATRAARCETSTTARGLPVLQGCVRSALPTAYEQWSQELQLVIPGSRAFPAIWARTTPMPIRAEYWSCTAAGETRRARRLPLNSQRSGAALFGQATARLSDRWSATAGVRLSREEHRMFQHRHRRRDSPTLASARSTRTICPGASTCYALTDDAMAYASVSTGYKSGGFVGFPPPRRTRWVRPRTGDGLRSRREIPMAGPPARSTPQPSSTTTRTCKSAEPTLTQAAA